METKGNSLEYLDLVVQPFAESVGFSVFPAVLDVIAPVPYGAGGGVDFFHFGSIKAGVHQKNKKLLYDTREIRSSSGKAGGIEENTRTR